MPDDIVIGNVKYRRVHGDWTMTPNGTRGMFHIDPRRRELLDEIERLRAALALADHVVDSLRDAFDPSLSEETHDTIFGVWQEAQKALVAYEEDRREQ